MMKLLFPFLALFLVTLLPVAIECQPTTITLAISSSSSSFSSTGPSTINPPASSTGTDDSSTSTCRKTCIFQCIKGTECRTDTDGCVKCLPIQTTTQPTQPTCPLDLCQSRIESGECEFGCEANFVACTYKCKEPRLGETVRTVGFQLTLNLRRAATDEDTTELLADAMREIATKAKIPASDYIINNGDIYRLTGRTNSKQGKWQIKIGFRAIDHPDGDERKVFIKTLKKYLNPTAITYDALDSILAGIAMEESDAETLVEQKEFYETQTCADGRTLSADKQCVAVTSSVAATTTSSSSTPIAAIIGCIIGGIVLIAIIATALIIHRRRRLATVKSMEGIARDTAALELNPAVTGEDRV